MCRYFIIKDNNDYAEEMTLQILAERLKEVRESLGISQKSAAKALLITNTSLSNYELNISLVLFSC